MISKHKEGLNMLHSRIGAVALLALGSVSETAQACYDPYKPRIERFEDGSVQLNTYAEGVKLCIRPGFKPENGCLNCVAGEFHTCSKSGNWITRGETCEVPKAPLTKKSTPQSSTVAEAEQAARKIAEQDQQPVQSASSSGSSDLEAVYQSCKSQPPEQVSACVQRELAKTKSR